MTDHREANDKALVTLISDTAVVSRATAQGLIAALRAAGYTVAPPGAAVPEPRCMAALCMVREAIETLFGPRASLEGPEAVLLRGPELHHDAEAIVDALRRLAECLPPPGEIERLTAAMAAEREARERAEAALHMVRAKVSDDEYRLRQRLNGGVPEGIFLSLAEVDQIDAALSRTAQPGGELFNADDTVLPAGYRRMAQPEGGDA